MNVFIAEHPYIFAIIVIYAISVIGDAVDTIVYGREADE